MQLDSSVFRFRLALPLFTRIRGRRVVGVMDRPSVGGVAEQTVDRVLRESQALVVTEGRSRMYWRTSTTALTGLERALPGLYESEASRGLPKVFIFAEVNVGPAGVLTRRRRLVSGWQIIRMRFKAMVAATQWGEVARAGRPAFAVGLPWLRMIDVAAPRGSIAERKYAALTSQPDLVADPSGGCVGVCARVLLEIEN